VFDTMLSLAKIICDKKSFNNGIRCLREALKRNECDKKMSVKVHNQGRKGWA